MSRSSRSSRTSSGARAAPSLPPPVQLVGLTGGIGSGKSTVATMLGRLGAVVFDADEFARRAIDPGTPGEAAVAESFGPAVLTPAGTVDRGRLAAIVFADPEARSRLEAIVHPEVARLLPRAVAPYRKTRRVVVYDVPLLVENHLESMFDVVVVVDAPEEVRMSRLAAHRGMSPEAVRARMAVQVSDHQRNAVAHEVIMNDGTLEELEQDVEALWHRLEAATELR
jgi:dephospho-CoA kinase